MDRIPKKLYHLFWDIKIETFNPIDYPEYTIGRILEFGDKEEVTWMRETFTETQIKSVIKSDKKLSPKSANFWSIIFGIPKNDVYALRNGRQDIL